MSEDISEKILKIAKEIGLKEGDLDDMGKFLSAVENYISKLKQSTQTTQSDSMTRLLSLVRGKTLEDPIVSYMLLDEMRKAAFSDGYAVGKMSSSREETRELREVQIELMKKVLSAFDNLIPVIQTMFQIMSQNLRFQVQSQTQNINQPFKVIFDDEKS